VYVVCVMCIVRLYKDNMLMHFVEIGKHPPVFEDASRVALELLQSPYEFDFGQLYYNVFRFLQLFCCFLSSYHLIQQQCDCDCYLSLIMSSL